ncbi:MAG: hypothetical protein VX920_12795, partial [Pseudomonadota bacterium]|nr:hypothetical protein [Pseudomonadota bacterium]
MHKASSLLCALAFSGCATLGNPEQDVSDALAEHDYARAASIVDNTSPKHAQYELLQTQYEGILLASKEYRQRLVIEAEALGRKQQWDNAFALLEG